MSGVEAQETHTLRHVRVNLALHRLRGGPGRALLLLHGLGERSPSAVPGWAAAWPGPVHALDFTGHGASTVPAGGGYTAEALMGDADAALAHLGPATVLGRGLGAYVALLIAGARPDLVRGAVLADGPGLAGGGSSPGSPYVMRPDGSAPAPPDPFALAELTRDVRPPDYTVAFVFQAVNRSELPEPIAVSARTRPDWLRAVVESAGVRQLSTPEALGLYARGAVTTPAVVRTPEARFDLLPDWPYRPHYLDVDGLQVHYVDEGPTDAEVFLLTHGEPSWSYLYRHWISALVSAGFRVVAPDHVGFGRSDKVTDDEWYTIDRHVGVQRALIDQLELSRINLFCQDWGGPISLRNACDRPHLYARLFIGNTWLHHDGYVYSDGLRAWHRLATDPDRFGGDMPTGLVVSGSLRRPGHDLVAVAAAYDAPFTGPASKAGARRFPWCLPFDHPVEGGADWQQACHDQLGSWSGPVHFVWGDRDEVFPWAGAQDWSAEVPGSTLDRVAGAGHFLQEDAPTDCVTAILGRIGLR